MVAHSDMEIDEPSGDVAQVFDSYDDPVRAELLYLRRLILTTAQETDGVGPIFETLKWGQPAYLTQESGSGSTIRLGEAAVDADEDIGMFFICHTHLIDRFRTLFGDVLTYGGDRALLFQLGDHAQEDEVRECIAMAQTYHLSKG